MGLAQSKCGDVCTFSKFALCEPRLEDLDDDVVVVTKPSSDGHSDLDHAVDVDPEHQEEKPSPMYSFVSSQMVARAVDADKHRADRERKELPMIKERPEAILVKETETGRPAAVPREEDDGWYDALTGTPDTSVASLRVEDFSVTCDKKTPIADEGQRRSARGRQLSRDPVRGTPPKHPIHQSRWSDDILEGFLFSTLVDGSGLVLVKLDSDGKGKKIGERILSYDPEAMKLNWVSTGMRRKPGSMLAKDIDEVLCEGTTVTIIYSKATSTGGTARRRSLSPMRRSSHQRKVFQTSQERDARILAELVLLVRRKALVAFSAVVSKPVASANAHATSRSSSTMGLGDDDDNGKDNGSDGDSDGGSADPAVTKTRSFSSGRVNVGVLAFARATVIMVSALVRTAVRRPAAAAVASARRTMSGDAAHAAEEMAKWKKMTAGMGALSVAVTAMVLATEEHHHADPDAPVPSYMQIRNKPFPWNCADCSLLDAACFAKCKEERS
eukprot:g15643.t1